MSEAPRRVLGVNALHLLPEGVRSCVFLPTFNEFLEHILIARKSMATVRLMVPGRNGPRSSRRSCTASAKRTLRKASVSLPP